jgi:hypothetical protein
VNRVKTKFIISIAFKGKYIYIEGYLRRVFIDYNIKEVESRVVKE